MQNWQLSMVSSSMFQTTPTAHHSVCEIDVRRHIEVSVRTLHKRTRLAQKFTQAQMRLSSAERRTDVQRVQRIHPFRGFSRRSIVESP